MIFGKEDGMPTDAWLWKEWSRQCTIAKLAILTGDLAEADKALDRMEELNATEPEKPADIPPAGLW